MLRLNPSLCWLSLSTLTEQNKGTREKTKVEDGYFVCDVLQMIFNGGKALIVQCSVFIGQPTQGPLQHFHFRHSCCLL